MRLHSVPSATRLPGVIGALVTDTNQCQSDLKRRSYTTHRNFRRLVMSFNDTMLTKSEVAAQLGCVERSLERRVSGGLFPPPLRFGKECVWFESVVVKWLDAQRSQQLAWEPRRTAKSPRKGRTAAAAATERTPSLKPVARESAFTAEELAGIGTVPSLPS